MTLLAGIHDTPEDDEITDEEEGSERVFNTQIVIGPDGTVRDAYRKVSHTSIDSYLTARRVLRDSHLVR